MVTAPRSSTRIMQQQKQQHQCIGEEAQQHMMPLSPQPHTADDTVNSHDFYSVYHGHHNEHNATLLNYYTSHMRNHDHHYQQHQAEQPESQSQSQSQSQSPFDGVIYLAGDSSLDNKFWFHEKAPAVNGYEHVLQPPQSVKDVCYWLNKAEASRAQQEQQPSSDNCRYGVINCAVEESTVGARARGRLLPQDRFIQQHITANDVLIVSVGGNDIALAPTPCTIINMLSLVKCATVGCIESSSCGTALPCDDPCYGCTTGCASSACAFPLGIGYFVHLFRTRISAYISNMLKLNDSSCSSSGSGNDRRVKKVLVCMIYYPDENADGSWADATLSALGYNHRPQKLQAVIRSIFKLATNQLRLSGHGLEDVEVVGVPLFAALDGTLSADYEARVEPSATGGEKMAALLSRAVHDTTTAFLYNNGISSNGGGVGGKGEMATAYREHEATTRAQLQQRQQRQQQERQHDMRR